MHAKGRTIIPSHNFGIDGTGHRRVECFSPLCRPLFHAGEAVASQGTPWAQRPSAPSAPIFRSHSNPTSAKARRRSGSSGAPTAIQLFIADGESVISLNAMQSPPRGDGRAGSLLEEPRAIRIELLGAAPAQRIEAGDPLPGRVNYLLGNNPAGWHTDIPTYQAVTQHGVWPGIDLIYYGDTDRRIESDFVVAPGADPRLIRFAVRGNDSLAIDRDGNLVIGAGRRAVTMRKPQIYQRFEGHRLAVDGRYAIDHGRGADRGEQRVRFEIASYDRRRTLVDSGSSAHPGLFDLSGRQRL